MMRETVTVKIFMIALIVALYLVFFCIFLVVTAKAGEKVRMAYISDSPGSSAPYWIAKETGTFKKQGLDAELIFINGSTRGIQTLIAGELDFVGAVGTSAINGRLAGGDIAIVDSLVNTLPYYIIGKPDIKSPEDLKGRALATHIPGTSADFAVRLALRKFGIDYKEYPGRHRWGCDGARRGCNQWAGGFYDGYRFGKNPRRKGRFEAHHRHGKTQDPVSVHLHGDDEKADPRAPGNCGENGPGGG